MGGWERARARVAAAVATLVGTGVAEAAEIDTGFLTYTEFDRVTAFEASVRARSRLGSGRTLDVGVTVDILTGASPNGANAADRPQIFTHPSGRGAYRVLPGETPADGIFQDNRGEVQAGITLPLGAGTRTRVGTRYSFEYDYVSLGLNGTLRHALPGENTVFDLGAAVDFDTQDPEGGRPIPFASMAPPGPDQPRLANQGTRRTVEIITGWTQVLGPTTLAQINLSWKGSNGYHTDPFKLLSVVDDSDGPARGEPVDYVFELRPDRRSQGTVLLSLKQAIALHTLDASYRFGADDWGIRSHTVDLGLRWALADAEWLRPRLRWYRQAAADFHRYSLHEGDPFPEHASADYRLARFTAITVGLGYGRRIGNVPAAIRLEYYTQSGESHPESAIGAERFQDLFPRLHALIAQVTASFDL